MRLGSAINGNSSEWKIRQPFRQPYEEIHRARWDGESFRITFEKPSLPNRLCLPADYSNNKLFHWNQRQYHDGNWRNWNPWREYGGSTYYAGLVALTIINSGSEVYLHGPNYADWEATNLTAFSGALYLTKDTVNHKFSYEFYVDNDLEETNPTVVFDDGGVDFWTLVDGSESNDATEKVKGDDSYKIELSSQTLDIYHDYASDQDWSSKEFLCLYIYGANTNDTIFIKVWNEAYASKTNGYSSSITDNFSGWKRFVLPLLKFSDIGSPTGWDHVKCIEIVGSSSQSCIYRIDRTVVDVGNWVKIEVYVPDKLKEDRSIKLYSYTGSDYEEFASWDAEDDSTEETITGSKLEFLDGTNATEIYDAMTGCLGLFLKSKRGESATSAYGSQSMTYSSYYGCENRIGFAIKMPPDDGQDSATTGISQCKLKLEVYYGCDDEVEDSAGENDGTNYGATQVSGKYGKALNFDGVDGTVDCGMALPDPTVFTLVAWIKPAVVSGHQDIVSRGQGSNLGGWELKIVNNGLFVGASFTDTWRERGVYGVISAGEWQMVAGVWDGTYFSVYVNGELKYQSEDLSAYTRKLSTSKVWIGAWNGDSNFFNGIIDDVRVYNRALSGDEISALFNGNEISDGLVSKWSFEDDWAYGKTTYEFSDDTNQFYGLQNWNEPWVAIFNPDGGFAYYFAFSKRPIGLKVCADENENIRWVEFKLEAGTRVFGGEVRHDNILVDSDGDGVPNIFEEPYDPNLVLDLPLDKIVDGKVLDQTKNGNDGTVYGTLSGTVYDATWVEGKYGTALDFTGDSKWVDCGSDESFDIVSQITLSAWIKKDASWNTQGIIIGKREGTNIAYGLFVTAAGNRLGVWMWDGANIIDVWSPFLTLNAGEWYHVTVTFDDSADSLVFYVNGVAYPETVTYTFRSFPDVVLGIGGYTGGGESFTGIIDDARVYNRVLSADEILDLYNGKDVGGGRVLCMRFDEGSGNTVYSDNLCEGKIGNAISLDGVDDYVSCPNIAVNRLTLSAWINPDVNNDWKQASVIAKTSESSPYLVWKFGLTDTGKLRSDIRVSGDLELVVSEDTVPVGEWTHIVFTFDGRYLCQYINGNTAGVTDLSDYYDIDDLNVNTRIGYDISNNRYFDGTIDDVRIYNRALSEAEIKAIYDTGRRGGNSIPTITKGISKWD